MSTLFPSLIHYQRKTTANNSLRERLRKISLDSLQEETDLSRHTILRARRGERLHPRLLQCLLIAARTLRAPER